MNRHALYHEPKSQYAYAYDDKLHLRFRSAKHDLKKVELVAFDPYSYFPNDLGEWEFDISNRYRLDMINDYSDDLFDYWFCEVNQIDSLRIRYAFLLDDGSESFFYGPYLTDTLEAYQKIEAIGGHYFNFPFINEEDVYQLPSWVSGSIWYQIFPERFHRSNLGPEIQGLMKWDEEKLVKNDMVFGGNLDGIIEKLDYIKELGITGIYFTPIFRSPSTHKYDTSDYLSIDEAFGSNQTLKRLIDEAHKRDIRVMLDGVFNHCGYDHPYWQDVLKNGESSKYYECFYINGSNLDAKVYGDKLDMPTREAIESLSYRMFGTAPNMPKWNTSNKLVRQHLIDVGRHWVKEYDIDGWRLDVSNEVSHSFWRAFRQAVKEEKADVYIIGENWDNSNPWLKGDQFDGVMNYELMNIIWNFIGVQNIREKTDVNSFSNELSRYLVNYPRNVLKGMFNMMDSHDTARVVTVCGGDERKAKLIYLLQFIMPGAPSIMYGSEIGLEGNFESARGCMVFDEVEKSGLYKFLKALIDYRKNFEVFRTLDLSIKETNKEKNILVLMKKYKCDELQLVVNNSCQHQSIVLSGKTLHLLPYDYQLTLNDQIIMDK